MRKIGILESRIYSNSYSDTSWVLLCNGSETQDGEGGLLLVASPEDSVTWVPRESHQGTSCMWLLQRELAPFQYSSNTNIHSRTHILIKHLLRLKLRRTLYLPHTKQGALKPRFSTGSNFAPRGHWQCSETFFRCDDWKGWCYWHPVVEATCC